MYKKEQTKKCPRCGKILHINTEKCDECNLNFSKIQNLSNRQAKIEIKHKMKNRVIYLTKKPDDVNFKRFLLFYIFLGWFGAHNIYVGKYKKGYFALISICSFFITFFLEQALSMFGIDATIIDALDYFVVSTFAILTVASIIIWGLDGMNLAFKKYKYPSAVPQIDFDFFNDENITNKQVKEEK